jgi:hypothetical protein
MAALLPTLATLVALPDAADAQGPQDPLFEAPIVGECKNYTLAEGAGETETSAPVDCATSHTAKVVAVKLLPDHLDWTSSQAALVRAGRIKCIPAVNEALGRTDKLRSMSAYTGFFFWPTEAQRANGARWIRCDVNLAAATKIVPLPVDTIPMLPPAPLPDTVRACLAGDNLYLTTCSRAHRYRATGGVTLDAGHYPLRERWVRIANNRCPDLTTTRAWYAFWPTRLEWLAGERTIVCYSKTTS